MSLLKINRIAFCVKSLSVFNFERRFLFPVTRNVSSGPKWSKIGQELESKIEQVAKNEQVT